MAEVVAQLAGFEVPAAAWEASVLPPRVRGYQREWLDQLTLRARSRGGGCGAPGRPSSGATPICLVPREDLDAWLGAVAAAAERREPRARPRRSRDALRGARRDVPQELARGDARCCPAALEGGLASWSRQGRVDLRLLRRRCAGCMRPRAGGASALAVAVGPLEPARASAASARRPPIEFVARQLLRRTGVVFRKTLAREKQPVPWRDLARACRTLEARGEIRGGRFVAGFDGEQYALPEAVTLLRAVRKREPGAAGPASPPPIR